MLELEISHHFIHSMGVHLGICGMLWTVIVLAILVDLWDRIYTNKKLGKKVSSHKMRITIDKFTEYWRFMLIAFTIDTVLFVGFYLYHIPLLPYASMALCIVLLIIEIKSLYEHAKERKSELVELKDLMQIVINATTSADAKEAIESVSEFITKSRGAVQDNGQ